MEKKTKFNRHTYIRSMSKAEYTTENIGHYGLAFPIIPTSRRLSEDIQI